MCEKGKEARRVGTSKRRNVGGAALPNQTEALRGDAALSGAGDQHRLVSREIGQQVRASAGVKGNYTLAWDGAVMRTVGESTRSVDGVNVCPGAALGGGVSIMQLEWNPAGYYVSRLAAAFQSVRYQNQAARMTPHHFRDHC